MGNLAFLSTLFSLAWEFSDAVKNSPKLIEFFAKLAGVFAKTPAGALPATDIQEMQKLLGEYPEANALALKMTAVVRDEGTPEGAEAIGGGVLGGIFAQLLPFIIQILIKRGIIPGLPTG